MNGLRQIGLGFLNWSDVYERLPESVHRDEAGEPISSWRFRILPFVEAIMKDLDYAERWDHPANTWITSRPHSPYCFDVNAPMPTAYHTNFVAITGPGTAFDEDWEHGVDDIDSDTILVIEVAQSGIPWAAPGDLPASEVTPAILDGSDGDGLNVLFADGAVWFIRNTVEFDDLRKFFSVESAKEFDRDRLLGPHR